jgi:succinoglycan biosynthesis protein ExoM
VTGGHTTTERERARSRQLTIAVATYLRPRDIDRCLAGLLREVDRLHHDRTDITAQILVVDNDAQASAREVVSAYGVGGVRYVVEPRPGISAARNRALDECPEADLLVFVDDDEEPVAGWLGHLLTTRDDFDAAAVAGRVVSNLDGLEDEWIAAGQFFRRRTLATGTPITVAATNNLLLDLDVVRRLGIRFDDRYGMSGGGDTHFTRSLVAAGARMIWCDEAVMIDHVPSERLTRAWVLARAQRMGNTEVVIDIDLADTPGQRMSRRLKGLGRGSVRYVGGHAQRLGGRLGRSLPREARGARTAARGRGMLRGAVGHRVHEYERPQPSAEA